MRDYRVANGPYAGVVVADLPDAYLREIATWTAGSQHEKNVKARLELEIFIRENNLRGSE